MEAKVDIRKLQLLNERINQTIDALNQVRMSVHGLSHTAGQQAGGWTPNVAPFQPGGYGLQPQTPTFWGPGLQHTPAVNVPYGAYGTYGMTQVPAMIGFSGGISHTSPDLFDQRILELRLADQNRLAQSFPFAFNQVSPASVW